MNKNLDANHSGSFLSSFIYWVNAAPTLTYA